MTATGRQQWDDGKEMALGGQQHAECLCKCCAIHPKQQSTNVTVWGGGDEKEG